MLVNLRLDVPPNAFLTPKKVIATDLPCAEPFEKVQAVSHVSSPRFLSEKFMLSSVSRFTIQKISDRTIFNQTTQLLSVLG